MVLHVIIIYLYVTSANSTVEEEKDDVKTQLAIQTRWNEQLMDVD